LTRIPFNKPGVIGREIEYVQEAIARMHISGDGHFTKRVNSMLEEILAAPKVLLTTSCTHALEMAALLLNLNSGDEFIVPSFTFVSTANAFVLRNARPVFADIRPDTLNLDESRLEPLIGSRTRAIVVVHYAGVGCEMEPILRIAARHGVPVIEDNAHGLMGRYWGTFLGKFGCLSTLSFHETKNFSCGEGGALVINDPSLIERAEILREKGTDRSRFFRGLVDKYSWIDIGSSYLPSDMLAAFLYAQLECRDQIQRCRQRAWDFYRQELSAWAADRGIGLPCVPAHCDQAFHMFYLILPSLEDRQALIAHLAAHSICSVFHYLPLHLSKMGIKYGGKAGDCPVTESISDRLLRLPFYSSITEAEQSSVVGALKAFAGQAQYRGTAI
jgi:dTDP-4-amino-4,6-dideoxygalactose transaminase